VKRWLLLGCVAPVLLGRAHPCPPEDCTSTRSVADQKSNASLSGSALEEFTRLLAEAQKTYTLVNDYVSTIVVQERIEGELRPREVGLFKFRKPFSVYIKWREGQQTGMQVLYVRDQNNGKLLARKPGLLGLVTFRLDPTSKLALADNRHPITEAGIGFLLDVVESNRKRAVAEGRARVRRLDDNPRMQPRGPRYELLVEADEKAGYYCRRARVTVDPITHLLIAAQVFDWDNQLIEDYRFLGLQLNVGLTDRAFDPKNPNYGF